MRQGNNPRRNRGRSGNRRPGGNNQQRSFDSNGPEGRIRGNASQVYEKYLGLARDASAAGDRILAEAFHQHAEHYYRLLNDSTDPENRRQQERRQQQNGEDQRGDQDGNENRDAQSRDNRDQDQGGRNQDNGGQADDERPRDADAQAGGETETRKPRRRKNGHDADGSAGETNGKKARRGSGDDAEQEGKAAPAETSGDEDVDGLHRAMQRSAGNGRRKPRAKAAAEESAGDGESADSSDSAKPAEGDGESAPQ